MTVIDASSPGYNARINRVIDYIESHIGESLRLDKLAEVAHFSPWHFHRVFAALTGETLADCIRRRRLERGASLLVQQPRSPVLKIALDVGFASAEVFSRNFREHFGVSPTSWHTGAWKPWAETQFAALHKIRHEDSKRRQAAEQLLWHNFGGPNEIQPADKGAALMNPATMPVNVCELPTYRVAYMRHVGPYGGSGIPALWQKMTQWCLAHGLIDEPHDMLGVSLDDPCVTPPDRCRYDACVEIGEHFLPSGEVNVQTVPGGRYACADFRGTVSDIGSAWQWLSTEWLPKSGLQFDARPCFEFYSKETARMPEPGLFVCRICIPVKPI